MTRIRAMLACAILVASGPVFAQEEEGPVPPVYVPEEQQGDAPSGPPATCQGQDCLPLAENPVQECKGQDCAPEPVDEGE